MVRDIAKLPKLKIKIERINSAPNEPSRFRWDVMLKAADAQGRRTLGYRGSGTIDASGSDLHFEQGPQVLDEDRPVWTTMNPTDRPDIRKQVSQLAREGLKKLHAEGGHVFEKTIP